MTKQCAVCGICCGDDDKDCVIMCGAECATKWLLADGVSQTGVDQVMDLQPGGPGIFVDRPSGPNMIQ